VRHLFDWLVVGQIVPHNPAASVRGPAHVVRRGPTPVIEASEAKALLDSIDASNEVGLRDRALIGLMLAQANAWAMARRRAKAAGIATAIGNHTFRATGIATYLGNGGTLENARRWPITARPGPPSCTIAGATRSRWRRSSGCLD